MIRPAACVLLICDRCEAPLAHADTDITLHYDTAAEARTDATAEWHWSTRGGRDLCPSCACTEQGHAWLGWWVPPPGSAWPDLAPCRWCERCGDVEIHDQPDTQDDAQVPDREVTSS